MGTLFTQKIYSEKMVHNSFVVSGATSIYQIQWINKYKGSENIGVLKPSLDVGLQNLSVVGKPRCCY